MGKMSMRYPIYTHSLLKFQLDFLILNKNLFKLPTFSILLGQIILFMSEVLATKNKKQSKWI